MKLIIAIVNRDDAAAVADALRRENFHFTRLASSGGFLLSGNVTVLCGVPEARVHTAVELIKSKVKNRSQPAPIVQGEAGAFSAGTVKLGGVTLFVVDVEQFERV